jgi:fucose permease
LDLLQNKQHVLRLLLSAPPTRVTMATHFGAILDIESKPAEVQNPPTAHAKAFTAPLPLELDELDFGSRYNGPSNPYAGAQTPITPMTPGTQRDFLMSRPPSPRQDEAVGVVASWNNPPMNKWRILCVSLTYFANGLSDGVAGALIPYMETHYNIGYAIVSLIFVTNAIGFLSAAFLVDFILHKLGRAKTLMFAEILLIFGYTIIACTPPFPLVVVAFYFLGFAFAITLAMNNVFVGTLADSTVLLGFAQGAYGAGATVAPIIATVMVSGGILWSRFYCVALCIRVICFIFDGWAFWNYEKEGPTRLLDALHRTASRRAALDAGEPTKRQLLAKALKNRVTLVGALYTFAYQGAEVAISGWVISFLITYRHGDPSSVGYVTAGFWGGITVGRFAFSHAIGRLGEKRSLFVLAIGAIVFELIVWLVPNVIGDAVAVSIVGLLLGPIAPCSTVLFLRLLPSNVQTSSVSFISSAGSSGGALAPFLTGLVAQAAGTWVLHPICIGLFVVMLACWGVLPKEAKRDE